MRTRGPFASAGREKRASFGRRVFYRPPRAGKLLTGSLLDSLPSGPSACFHCSGFDPLKGGSAVDDRRWDRLAAGTGVAFVGLLLASTFVVPNQPPKIDDPIRKIGAFYAKHHSGLLWGGWLGMLAVLFGLWFIGTVAHWVRRQNQPRLATIAFGGG